MKKRVLRVLIINLSLIILVSCKAPVESVSNCDLPKELRENQDKPSEDSLDSNPVCLLPEKLEEANLEVDVTLKDFNTAQAEKMNKALDRLLIVINSKEFKNRVLDHTYQNKKMFVDNNGLSNLEIYEKIMLGAEELNPPENQQIDLNITLYYANNGTVGYTYPDVNRIWVNDKFFAGYTYAKVAENVVHEWCHKLGFTHDFNRTNRRNFSVPYAIGTIVQNLIEDMTPQLPAPDEEESGK